MVWQKLPNVSLHAGHRLSSPTGTTCKSRTGFLRSIKLWGSLAAADAALTEECTQVIRLFATEAGFARLETVDEDGIIAQQQLIEPAVRRLFRHFFKQREQASAPYVRERHKVGRNDPCTCGSGKKFKHCCLH